MLSVALIALGGPCGPLRQAAARRRAGACALGAAAAPAHAAVGRSRHDPDGPGGAGHALRRSTAYRFEADRCRTRDAAGGVPASARASLRALDTGDRARRRARGSTAGTPAARIAALNLDHRVRVSFVDLDGQPRRPERRDFGDAAGQRRKPPRARERPRRCGCRATGSCPRARAGRSTAVSYAAERGARRRLERRAPWPAALLPCEPTRRCSCGCCCSRRASTVRDALLGLPDRLRRSPDVPRTAACSERRSGRAPT